MRPEIQKFDEAVDVYVDLSKQDGAASEATAASLKAFDALDAIEGLDPSPSFDYDSDEYLVYEQAKARLFAEDALVKGRPLTNAKASAQEVANACDELLFKFELDEKATKALDFARSRAQFILDYDGDPKSTSPDWTALVGAQPGEFWQPPADESGQILPLPQIHPDVNHPTVAKKASILPWLLLLGVIGAIIWQQQKGKPAGKASKPTSKRKGRK